MSLSGGLLVTALTVSRLIKQAVFNKLSMIRHLNTTLAIQNVFEENGIGIHKALHMLQELQRSVD